MFRRLEPPGPGAPRHDDLSEAAYAALVDPVVNREPRQTSGAAATGAGTVTLRPAAVPSPLACLPSFAQQADASRRRVASQTSSEKVS